MDEKTFHTKKIIHSAAAFLLLLFLIKTTAAISIGAGPATVEFKDMVRGGYAEEIITVSTAGEDDLQCKIEVEGPLKGWFSYEPGATFTLPANSNKKIKLKVNLPKTISNDVYEDTVYIRAAPLAQVEEGTGLIFGAGIGIKVKINVTGKEVMEYKIKQLTVMESEVGEPIPLSVTVANTGNVQVTPVFHIKIMNADKTKVMSEVDYEALPLRPTTETKIDINISSEGFVADRYWADFRAYLKEREIEKQLLDFRIYAIGALLAGGELDSIIVSSDVKPGETAKVTAVFVNSGRRTVTAQFLGEVRHKNRLVGTFESKQVKVDPGRDVEIPVYYTVEESGDYVFSGYVEFSERKTETKEAILKVGSPTANLLPIIVVAFIVIVVVLIVMRRRRVY